jgi:TPR repeat protein
MYSQGRGVSQDHAEPAYWYRKAADQGDADAQNNLGPLYAQGKGVSQDQAEAAYWYRKAADKGHATARLNLGRLYEAGGVAQD